MLTNYLKIAWRNITRNKVFSTINILGLSLGMAVVLLITVFVKHEFSYDQFIPEKENIYRVYRYWSSNDGRTYWTPSRLAEKLKEDFPEVIASTGLSPFGEQLLEYRGDKQYVELTAQVDSTFFRTMALPFLHGDPKTALDHPEAIVISDRLAKRIFGDSNPIGETIRVSGETDMQVTGVIALTDKNSHLNYDLFRRFMWYSDSWTGNNRATYIRVQPEANLAVLGEKLNVEMKKLIKKEFLSMNYTPKPEDYAEWKFQPMTDIHLRSGRISMFNNKAGDIRNIYIFLLIGALVLIVAIVNYVNLATAQATKRAKEVGVRKASGALRTQLTGQFMAEAFFQASLAAVVALVIAEALLPVFNTVTDRELEILGGNAAWVLLPLLGLTGLTGLLAGFYPALILSGFKPVTALKTNFLKSGEKGGFRKVLVTVQFTVTIALLVVMAFIYRQVNFMMDHELGFQPDQVMSIPLNFKQSQYKVESLKSALKSIPGIKNVTTVNSLPGDFIPDWGIRIEGRDEAKSPYVQFADADYLQTLGLEMKEGRFFSAEIAADTVSHFVVNEAFVEQNNLENPVGTRMKFSSDTTYGEIIGVVKDYHFRGLQRSIAPLIIHGYHLRWKTAIQLSTANLSNTIFEIEKLWKQIEPEHPMRYTFLDEDFAEQYAEQERFGQTMLYATFLTLFIAILGLFGLTAFNVERRTKEIGIRKVLGASTSSIVGLLSKDFLSLVMIAFLIAIPIGWYATNLWLEDFAFRTEIAWWVFALAGALAILVAFATMAFQSTRAAMANPVDSLRSE
ncbi:MAG: ABC transporter permease [Bacteroidota bacterium]